MTGRGPESSILFQYCEDLFDAFVKLLLRHIMARVSPECLILQPQADDSVGTQPLKRPLYALSRGWAEICADWE